MLQGSEEKPHFEILWCADAWIELAASLQDVLPSWATLSYRDPKRPLEDQVSNSDILIPSTAKVGPEVIAAAAKLQLVVQPAAGYNNIAYTECAARDIPLCTMKGLNAVSTAEGALCCILMLARRAIEQQATFRRQELGGPLSVELSGKTLGIIGLGAVGKHLARIAAAMGMKVLSTDSRSSKADLTGLLRDSDVVSIHCPLNSATHGLISKPELDVMKPGVLLVNYARGAIIDEEAVTEAVMQGKIGGLGLDTHWEEPADPSKPLYNHPRVLSFPHTGSSTVESMQATRDFMARNIVALHEGKPLESALALPLPGSQRRAS